MKTELPLILVWLFLCLTTSHRDVNPRLENDKVLALQQTLKTLFDLPEFEPQPGNSVEPPRHMVHLLQHLSKAGEWSQERKWNTIRTIRPQLGPICEMDNLFRFDLTSLPPKEGVVSVQFHFFKLKIDIGKHEDAKVKLDIFEIYPKQCQLIRSLKVPLASEGWQVADFTSGLNVTKDHRLDTSFALRFRVDKGSLSPSSAKTASAYIEENIIRHANPFVLAFTRDSALKEDKSEQAHSETDGDGDSSGFEPDEMYFTGNVTYRERQRRSVHTVPLQTNEYPEVMDEETYYNVHETFPKFSERNKKRKSKRRSRTRKVKSKRKHTTTLLEKQRKKSKKKDEDRHDYDGQSQPWNICSRRVMKVDFGMIGWNNYVISPKSFDAYFCAGDCPFPMTKELNPSNHAAIQSIVHALDAVKDVPPPCCVPDKLSPLSILYFDITRNVVLKVYPNMAVDTCACH